MSGFFASLRSVFKGGDASNATASSSSSSSSSKQSETSSCYLCERAFASAAAYREHVQRQHTCSECGAVRSRRAPESCGNCAAVAGAAQAQDDGVSSATPRLAAVAGALEHISVYETRSRVFVVGCTADREHFCLLKVERATGEAALLALQDDHVVYTRDEKDALLRMIDTGNKAQGGLVHVRDAFGLLGFVRFLHGHYLILITRRRPVGLIGRHRVYAIDETAHYHLRPPDSAKDAEHAAEKRYKDLFFGVDVTKGFYFSYTYDLTHSVQHNMTPSNHPRRDDVAHLPPDWHLEPLSAEEAEAAAMSADDDAAAAAAAAAAAPPPSKAEPFRASNVRAAWQFVWNAFLMRALANQRLTRWMLPVIHGHFEQRLLSEFGRTLQLTLIARRSRMYAGVRFLKRGVNQAGYVGNDVETEQIVADISATAGAPAQPPLASFVQLRGSIPLFWSQENKMFEPKPAINIGRVDPFYTATVRHFANLMRRYGFPVMVLNLVKQYEKLPRESKVNAALNDAMSAVNHSLPPDMQIPYVAWDWKAAGKRDLKGMIAYMCSIAETSLDHTGYFCSRPPRYRNEWLAIQRGDAPVANQRVAPSFASFTSSSLPAKAAGTVAAAAAAAASSAVQQAPRDEQSAVPATLVRVAPPSAAPPTCYVQRGALRTNCIDSLDRTNAAHFLVGRAALGRQLYALGLLSEPVLGFTDSAVELLMEMYEIVGNQVALQYAGSEAVHTMKTYNKGDAASQARDLLTTVKRYISNSFTDSEKQNGINLFLGRFEPSRFSTNIWELESDWQLHNREQFVEHRLLITEAWWRTPLREFERALGSLAAAPTAPPVAPWREPPELPNASAPQQPARASARSGESSRALRRRLQHRVSDMVWHEWYAVTSMSSFDAILSRDYNWPTRHYTELLFTEAGSDAGGTARRSQLSDGGGDADRGGALSTQLSGIKKFIPFGRRTKKKVVKRQKPAVWNDFNEMPPLWRALLSDSEHAAPPPRYHYSLAAFAVALNERADSLALYRRTIAEADIDARVPNARTLRRTALTFYSEHVRRTDGRLVVGARHASVTVAAAAAAVEDSSSPRSASSAAVRGRSTRQVAPAPSTALRRWSAAHSGSESARYAAYCSQFDTSLHSARQIEAMSRSRCDEAAYRAHRDLPK
jgi:hypothetical protein